MRIDRFQYPDGTHMPPSNFYPWRITLDGYEWPDNETYYQAAKTVDPLEYHAVRMAGSPGQAKRLGRKVKLRPDWEAVKFGVMRRALAAKFSPGNVLADWLIETGDALLVEGNTWHDTTWGVCVCDRHGGAGENWLGALLMVRRAELRSGEVA